MLKEFSAGGLVGRDGRLLLVRVKNLKGEKVWTFPKGHLEDGETPIEAAIREVEEETGWRCGLLKPLLEVGYRFRRDGKVVVKKVKWFILEPLEVIGIDKMSEFGGKTGGPDPNEILVCKWVPVALVPRMIGYPSDFQLIELWHKENYMKDLKS
jgi:8-oxo-dGTP pyrophosphatase MutT (NUDIX family)